MITINSAPNLNAILLDNNNTLISVTSDNGVGFYFRAKIYINNTLFDEQSWSRKDNFTAEKELKKLYYGYFKSVFNPVFENGFNNQMHLTKKVDITIEELNLTDDTVVETIDLDTFFIMYNVKPIPFDSTPRVQILGVDPKILQIPINGKIAIPFLVNTNNQTVLVQLRDNDGTVLDEGETRVMTVNRVFIYTFDLSTIQLSDAVISLDLKIAVGGSKIFKKFRILKNPNYPVKEIVFLNNFGYWLYAYLDGQLKIENNLDVKIYEELDNTEKIYEINEKQNYSISTGSLIASEKEIINQIATALEAKIFLNNEYIAMINATKKVTEYKDLNNLYSENLTFSVKKNNAVANQNITTNAVPNVLTISNIELINGFNYEVTFDANFELTELFLEVSADGITWSDPIAFPALTSPQTFLITHNGFQYARITDVNFDVTTVSSVYHYVIIFGIQEKSRIYYNTLPGGFTEADLNINIPNIATIGSLKWRVDYTLIAASYTDSRVNFRTVSSLGFQALAWFDYLETNGKKVGRTITPIKNLIPPTSTYTQSPINCQLRARTGHTIKLELWLYDANNVLIGTANYTV